MKLFIRNLKQANRIDTDTWKLDLILSDIIKNIEHKDDEIRTQITFKLIQLNGIVEQIVPGDILIINDGTAKVKLTNCKETLFNYNTWIRKGSSCSVFGYLRNTLGLPEVHVTELYPACVTLDTWLIQVKDFQLFQMNLLEPEL